MLYRGSKLHNRLYLSGMGEFVDVAVWLLRANYTVLRYLRGVNATQVSILQYRARDALFVAGYPPVHFRHVRVSINKFWRRKCAT